VFYDFSLSSLQKMSTKISKLSSKWKEYLKFTANDIQFVFNKTSEKNHCNNYNTQLMLYNHWLQFLKIYVKGNWRYCTETQILTIFLILWIYLFLWVPIFVVSWKMAISLVLKFVDQSCKKMHKKTLRANNESFPLHKFSIIFVLLVYIFYF